jgi:hypothetical protein
LTVAIRFLRESLPQEIINNLNITSIPNHEVESSLLYLLLSTEIPQQQLDLATKACRNELCPLLHWSGEPDASGVGVGVPQVLPLSFQSHRKRSQS